MIRFTHKGNFTKTDSFLGRLKDLQIIHILESAGAEGVARLQEATPKDTGLTAASWEYVVNSTQSGYELIFKNENRKNGVPIAFLIYYGHGMPNGGYIEGIDYINPALEPVFEELKNKIDGEVSKL